LLCVFVIAEASRQFLYLRFAVFLVLISNNLWFTWHERTDADHNLGYADAVAVHREAAAFCARRHWQGKYIATHFLFRQYLGFPPAGYIREGEAFTRLEPAVTDSTDIAVISSTEYSAGFRHQIKRRNGNLLKRFEKRNAWTEIYLFGDGKE
jgi:hypothetical protein